MTVTRPPLVLSMTGEVNAAPMVNVPSPKAPEELILSCPALRFMLENVLFPERVSVPFPNLLREKAPEIFPRAVRLEAFVVTCRFADKVILPVPKLRSLVPKKVKSPFQF